MITNICDDINNIILSDKFKKQYIELTSNKQKISTSEFIIPTFKTAETIITHKFSLPQLKTIAKEYKIKVTGNKNQLTNRIYFYLFLSNKVIHIQKIFRGHLLRKYNKSHGPAYFNRKLCTNASDFLTMDPIDEISSDQFFSFTDKDGFVYGFDIMAFYNLIYKSDNEIKNPYNRLTISQNIITQFRQLIRISRVLHIKISTDLSNVLNEVSSQKSIELRALTLFQNINALGNYSDPKWWMNLTQIKLFRFMHELTDIWEYRAQLTIDIKRQICPPNGMPFRNKPSTYMDLNAMREYSLKILELFVNTGISNEFKSLGASYVLGALTLVNEDAAAAIPWLYQAFNYHL